MSIRKSLVEALSLIDRGLSGVARKEVGKALIGLQELENELAEAKARAIPDGWVAVPAKPTAVMRDTFCADPGSATYFSHTTLRCEDFGSRYRAMLSARPDLPKEPSDVE